MNIEYIDGYFWVVGESEYSGPIEWGPYRTRAEAERIQAEFDPEYGL
ncbi:MAG: hypothetical protein ACRDHG_04660 [Anaerolineales bacterium]